MNIQIMKIYKESFHNVCSHKWEWVKVGFGPYLIWTLSSLFVLFSFFLGGNYFDFNKLELVEPNDPSVLHSILFILSTSLLHIINFIAATSLCINGYRYAILQEGGDRWLTFNINMRFLKIVIYEMLVGIMAIIYILISCGIIMGSNSLFESVPVNVILGIPMGLCSIYLMFRIGLYPVVISMDQHNPLKTSWQFMKGNVLRLIGLFLVVGLTLLLIALIGVLILGLITALLALGGSTLGELSLILWIPFGLFMTLLSWALYAKATGLVYQELSEY